MARFSKALRERIVREFTARHNGRYDPAVFVEEVKAAGPDHEAYEWFEWDDEAAASSFRVEQARSFVQGINISFTVETLVRGNITVSPCIMPLVVSPMEGRRAGGGYVINNPDNPDHVAEFCGQAARDLDAWLRRYRAAVLSAGGSTAHVERLAALLLQAANPKRATIAA